MFWIIFDHLPVFDYSNELSKIKACHLGSISSLGAVTHNRRLRQVDPAAHLDVSWAEFTTWQFKSQNRDTSSRFVSFHMSMKSH